MGTGSSLLEDEGIEAVDRLAAGRLVGSRADCPLHSSPASLIHAMVALESSLRSYAICTV